MKIKLVNADIKFNYVEELLKERGVADVKSFLNPEPKFLQSWTDLDNIKEGIEMLLPALETTDWKVLIVTDSDADGFCSASIIYNWMDMYNKDVKLDFIVHEGKQHGLEDIVLRIDLNDYNLVILPDAGVNDDEYFKKYPAVDFLVLDHHKRTKPLSLLPDNVVIINNQLSDNYQNKSLCGAGVTWQFTRALDAYFKKDFSSNMIDRVAVATVSDVMDLTNLENRYLVKTGLNNIVNTFLEVIVAKQSYSLGSGPLTPVGVSFYIAPLINAMCRVGTLEEKERMFLAFVDGERLIPSKKRGANGALESVAVESVRECTNARARQVRLQNKMKGLAEVQIINEDLLENKVLTIVLDDTFDGIPSEINGLTASKLAGEYKRPTIVVRENDEGFLRGSARGLDTLDMPGLKEFFESSELFEYAEGHSNAHGVSLPSKNLSLLHEWANTELADVDFNEDVWEVNFIRAGADDDISDIIFAIDNYKEIWGHGNPTPLIYIKNLNLTQENVTIIGANKDTVKITKGNISYMLFKQTKESIAKITQYPDLQLDLVGDMNVNEYYGSVTPQIFIKDFEARDGRLSF